MTRVGTMSDSMAGKTSLRPIWTLWRETESSLMRAMPLIPTVAQVELGSWLAATSKNLGMKTIRPTIKRMRMRAYP